MNVLLVNYGSSKTLEIQKCLIKAGCNTEIFDFNKFSKGNNEPLLCEYHGVVLSGAPRLITRQDVSAEMMVFQHITAAKTPLLAICFSHQLLSIAHGATVTLGPEDRCEQRIEITEQGTHSLFKGLPSDCIFTEDHTEYATLPEGWILLARSGRCTNEAMKHPVLPWYGVQFHPEVSGANGQMVFENFLELL
jgi:GMP synthase-like glutamine amidotransferase